MRQRKRMLLNLILFLAIAPLAACTDLTGMDELEDDFQAFGKGLVEGWTDHGGLPAPDGFLQVTTPDTGSIEVTDRDLISGS